MLVLGTNGVVFDAPAAQQHQQRTLCAVARKLHRILIVLNEERLPQATEVHELRNLLDGQVFPM